MQLSLQCIISRLWFFRKDAIDELNTQVNFLFVCFYL